MSDRIFGFFEVGLQLRRDRALIIDAISRLSPLGHATVVLEESLSLPGEFERCDAFVSVRELPKPSTEATQLRVSAVWVPSEFRWDDVRSICEGLSKGFDCRVYWPLPAGFFVGFGRDGITYWYDITTGKDRSSGALVLEPVERDPFSDAPLEWY